MVKVDDHRFQNDWPIKFEVPKGHQCGFRFNPAGYSEAKPAGVPI